MFGGWFTVTSTPNRMAATPSAGLRQMLMILGGAILSNPPINVTYRRVVVCCARASDNRRGVGEQNPFLVGTDGVQRYLTVMTECAMASKLRNNAK